MMKATFFVLSIAVLATFSAVSAKDQFPTNFASEFGIRVRFVGKVDPTNSTNTLVPGQDARFQLTMTVLSSGTINKNSHTPLAYLFNATTGGMKGSRVRIIPAYAGRAMSGTVIRCRGHTEYWAEYWGLSATSYLFGDALVSQGTVMFTVPPFPYRVCVSAIAVAQNKTGRNYAVVNASTPFTSPSATVWSDLYQADGVNKVYKVADTANYFWTSASTMYADDFAAIKIVQNGYQHAFRVPGSLTDGDIVKLVPAGFPCTYDNIRSTSGRCHGGQLNIMGDLKTQTTLCATEGSVQNGVGRIGTTKFNPFTATRKPQDLTLGDMAASVAPEDLVAYFRLPAVGTYDVCFSARNSRVNSTGIFTKIFQQDSTCTGASVSARKVGCLPKGRLVITANADALRWSTPHFYPGGWGVIKIYHPSGTATQQNGQASSWELSATRSYYTTVGGDQFRMVRRSKFTSTAMTYGKVYYSDSTMTKRWTTDAQLATTRAGTKSYMAQNRLDVGTPTSTFGSTAEVLTFLMQEQPDLGTAFPLSTSTAGGGCWNTLDDNYGNYNKGLNGINSGMLSTCCSASSSPFACLSTTGCSLSDSDHQGVTASADLGADPRSAVAPWTISATAAVAATWAYVRFPVGDTWNMCYRLVGTNNWRVIKAATGNDFLDPLSAAQLNYTYHVNDSQATTWGPLRVRDPQKRLTTLNSNLIGTVTPVVGSSVKIVRYTASCHTDAGVSETFSSKPGLAECEVGCYLSGTCNAASCIGQADDSNTLRSEVTFYVRMPTPLTGVNEYYRVCFQNLDESWIQLQDPGYIRHSLMTSPWKFNTRVAPSLDFSLQDYRQGTWGKFLFRRLSNLYTQAFNIDANNNWGSGDVMRLVPNVTATKIPVHCDVTVGASSANGDEFVLQNLEQSRTNWNFGMYCVTGSSQTASSPCYTAKVSPSDGTYYGTYPYLNIDSTADGSYISDFTNQGAVAFLTVPNSLAPNTAAYRLCYKPQASNWIEVENIWSGAPNPFLVAARPAHSFAIGASSGSVSSVYAGQYGYVAISGATINLDQDLVKLVLSSSGGCDRPAAGTQSNSNKYQSFSWRKLDSGSWTEGTRGGAAFVAATAVSTASATLGTRSTTTSARAYMVFPTLATLSADTTAYKVCYMTRASGSDDTKNWHHLGDVNVVSTGIMYTAEEQPYNGATIGIRFVTAGTNQFNTNYQGDAAKVVAITDPCLGTEWTSANRPNGVTSKHVGQETNYVVMGAASENVALVEGGIIDMGPSDLAATGVSRFDTTLPWSTARTYYKVCYRLSGKDWVEVEQAPLAQQVYALGTDNLYTVDSSLREYTTAAGIRGITPFTSAVYATGLSYTNALIGGAATVSIGSSNTSYFYASYASAFTNYATDSFKLVQYAREVVRGTFQNLPNINCKSPAAVTGNPGPASTSTLPSLTMNLPTEGGRYLLCYKKTGLDVWIQLPAATNSLANPITIIPNALSFEYSTSIKNFTVNDLFSGVLNSVDSAWGGINSDDSLYIVNSTDVCGVSHSFQYDVKNPGTTLSLASTLDNAPKKMFGSGNVSQTVSFPAPTAAGWYKVCYKRTGAKTMNDGVVPFTPVGWYQVVNRGTTNGAGSAFFVTAAASKLKINRCPRYNATYPLRTGTPVDITVSVLDASSQVLPFAIGTWAYLITAVPAADTIALRNTRGQCRAEVAPTYGWANSNLRQWAENGMVTFSLSIVSGCPSGLCTFTFAASDSIAAPGGTNTALEPASCTIAVKSVPISTLSIWSQPSGACQLDAICSVQVAAFAADKGLAHTATDDLTVIATNIDGLSVKGNTIALGASAVKVTSFASGFAKIDFSFDVSNGATFSAQRTVTFTLNAANKNASVTIDVYRPVLTNVKIIDFYPEDVVVSGLVDSDKFVRPFMVPSWEPAAQTYFPGALSASSGLSAISAAAGYHMVALQVYSAILRPVDQLGNYIDKVALLEPTKKVITITSTGSSFSSNAILATCLDSEVCTNAFSSVTFSAVKQKVSFRLKNNAGCTRTSNSNTGCTLTFKFDNADLPSVVSITTPVRSLATKLSTTCWKSTAQTESALGAGSTTGCPSSTVEVGVALKVQAVDDNGAVDEYFEGQMLPVLRGGNGFTMSNGVNLTTVAALQGSDVATVTPSTFAQGVAWVFGLTMTKPCTTGCNLQVLSNWGANMQDVGALVLTASTTKLTCKLTSQHHACTVGSTGECDSISGLMTYDSTSADNNKVSLLYKDTTVCATVTATDANGVPTLYESNWVMYWAQATAVSGTTVNPVTISDAGGASSRVKQMRRGSVSFCFKVDGNSKARATFNVRFAAQQFNGQYWSRVGQNGECSLGTFSVWNQKHVAGLVVTKVDGLTSLTTLPAAAPVVYAQRADAEKTTLSTTVTFGLRDHYGNAITAAQVVTAQQANAVVISACSLDSTGKAIDTATCTTSAIASTSSIAMTASTVQQKEGGVVTATLSGKPTVLLNDALSYTMTLDRWCLGCSLTFKVKTTSADYTTKVGTSDVVPTATLNMYVLFPAAPTARMLAFRYGTSPYLSYWQAWDATAKAAVSAATGSVVVFKDTCFTTDKSTCSPVETYFQPTLCDYYDTATTRDIAASKTGASIQMYVLSATQTSGSLNTKLEPSCGSSDDCSTKTNVVQQVDILNSYDVTVNVGSQILKCQSTGAACTDDMTASPKQLIAAFGDTVDAAVKSYAAVGTPRSTSFVVAGVYPSSYYKLSGTALAETVTPSYSSKFTATVTSNVTGAVLPTAWTTASYVFAFRGPRAAAKFNILDKSVSVECLNKPTYWCHGAACTYDGYQKSATLDTIGFSYAYDSTATSTIIPIATSVPISAEVQDANGIRVATAKGTVYVELYSWTGCNNGGTMTVTGAVNNKEVAFTDGRITAMVSFSAPCEQCVLRFTLLPDSTQSALYTNLNANKAQLTQFSKPINVRDNVAGTGTHLIATSVPAEQKADVTVADTITVNMAIVRSIGGLTAGANWPVQDKAASGMLYVYNQIQTTGSNWYWIGNGGVLRGSAAGSTTQHHSVTSTFTNAGSASTSFMFTRTCPGGCSVIVAYTVNGNTNSFLVKNAKGTLFTVSTASTKYLLVGWRPRMVQYGTDFSLSLWHAGEGENIPFAGVGATTLSAAVAQKVVEDASNGDGGSVVDQAFTLTKSEIHRVNVPAPCNRLRLKYGTDTARVNIYTVATTVRAQRPLGATAMYAYPMTSYATFSLYAVDSLGFVDVRVGGYTGGSAAPCFSYAPMQCPSSPNARVSCTLSANGRTAGGFSPSIDTFLAAKDIAGTMNTGFDKLVDGAAASIQVMFNKPVRHGYPIFSVSGLTSGTPLAQPVTDENVIDISVGTTGLNIVAQTSSTTSIPMYSPLNVEVGLVKVVADPSSTTPTSYIAVEADNQVQLTFSAGCPARDATSAVSGALKKGYVMLPIIFTGPTAANTPCTVSITAGSGKGVCSTTSACTTTFQITVTSVVVSSWSWVSPSAMDNAPLTVAGPQFGAAGRTSTLRIQLLGNVGTSATTAVRSCDDPSTTAVETCTFTVKAGSACTQVPTAISAASWNTSTGIATVTVTWKDSTTSYTCPLDVSVTYGTAATVLPVAGVPGASPTVTVCKPAGIRMLTNTSALFQNQYLVTGMPYRFVYAIVDAAGAHCRGDSQDDATVLRADLITADKSAKAITSMSLYNTNQSTTSVSGWVPASEQVSKAIAGTVAFNFWFTNSSVNLGLGGFRVRVTPSSGLATDGTVSAASGVLETVVGASKLRFAPETMLPKDWVMSRALNSVKVQAVDGLDIAMKTVPNVNIAKKATELGNNAEVNWFVDPLPSGTFPLTFTTGSKQQNLVSGEGTFAMTFSTARDGAYALGVQTSADSKLQAKVASVVAFQTETSLLLESGSFSLTAPATCSSNCILPNTTFTVAVNGTQFLNSTNLNAFNVKVRVADALGDRVRGENSAYIRVMMVKPATSQSTVKLSIPDQYKEVSTDGFWARVQGGVASFALGFTGSTNEGQTSAHTHVTLQFSCPAQVPARFSPNGVAYANPCAAFISAASVTTMPIRVIDPSVEASVFASEAVKTAQIVFKIPTTITSMAQLNDSLFKQQMADALVAAGYGFMIPEAIDLTVCEIDSTKFNNADLGSTVCGVSLKCTSKNPDCPGGVLACSCNSVKSLNVLLSRYLLQTSSNVKVQMEMKVNLQNAVGFAATSESAITTAYAGIAVATQKILTTDPAITSTFAIDVANVGQRTAAAVETPVTPTAPPPTAGPITSAPTNPPTTPTTASAFVTRMSMTLLAALLFAVAFIF